MQNRLPLVLAALAVVLVLALLIFAPHHKKQSKQVKSTQRQAAVEVTSKGFIPATLTVKSGTKVTWKNDDTADHRIKANPYPGGTDLPGLDSKVNLPNGATYSYTFSSAGTFGYHDQLHPTLNATVKVTN